MPHTTWVVAQKELIDNLRDRRSIFNSLLSVLLNPFIYIFLFGFLNQAFSEQIEQALQLPVVGGEYAPNLVAFLDQNNVDILPAPKDPQAALLAGEVDVVLIIPQEFPDDFQKGQPASVQLLSDQSSNSASIPANRAENLLEQYSRQVASLRLLARGISPALTAPVLVEAVDVAATGDGADATVLNLLPVIMLTAAFLGGFYLSVDMTAGERERESLEPLLINPAPRWALATGKFLAALGYTIFATVLATLVYLVLLVLPVVQEFTGLRLQVQLTPVIQALLLILPVVVMAVALQTLISSFARNVKEAQTYTQFLSLAGFMPGVFLAILPVKVQGWMYLVPTISQLFLINKVMRGDALPLEEALLSAGVTLLVGALALGAAIRLYRREKIVLIG